MLHTSESKWVVLGVLPYRYRHYVFIHLRDFIHENFGYYSSISSLTYIKYQNLENLHYTYNHRVLDIDEIIFDSDKIIILYTDDKKLSHKLYKYIKTLLLSHP